MAAKEIEMAYQDGEYMHIYEDAKSKEFINGNGWMESNRRLRLVLLQLMLTRG